MVRKILIKLMCLCVVMSLFGCKPDNTVDHVADDPPSPYPCEINEFFTNGTQYITFASFEITSEYYETIESTDDKRHFVVLGVNTNLIEYDFMHPLNEAEIWYPGVEPDLEFVEFDEENKKIIYEIHCDDSIDCAELCNLKSYEDGYFGHNGVYIQLQCFDQLFKFDYVSYRGVIFALYFE